MGVFGHCATAHALSSDPKQFISGDNTFYVYVKGGESVSAAFARVNFNEPFDTVRGDVAVTLDAPGIAQQKCVMPGNTPIGQGCQFPKQTAPQSGIWRIQFIAPDGAKTYNEVSPVVRWGKNWFNWNITVNNSDGQEQHGRLWTERYAIRQPADSNYADDFVNYYISEDGYIYKATELGYNGQISTLSADAIGIRTGNGCVSAYHSADVSSDKFSPALGTCGNGYKLFFESPAGDLPTKAQRWDKTADWIRPNISRPSISELHFASDNSQDQLSGTISFFLRNFIGQYQIKIDVENDGSFDGQSDVTLNEQMKKLDNGLQQIHFDGADKTGQIIPPTAHIGIQVVITKVAEIHLVAADVEGRSGGLELVRLNGDNAPSTLLCWNDTELTPLADETLMTKTLDGRKCPDSVGGVHGWKYNDSSWGNIRYIEDWIYASAKLTGSNQIVYPEAAEGSVAAVQRNWFLVGAIIVVTIMVLVGAVILVRRKSKRQPPTPPQTPQQPIQPMDPGGQPPDVNDRY